MVKKTESDFELFISQLQETNRTLGFFCDFDKIGRNVDEVRLNLCSLDFLIGAEDMRKAVEVIFKRDRKIFDVLGILIAVRDAGTEKVIRKDGKCYGLNTYFESVEGVMEFLNGTGLSELFQKRKLTNLADYVFGIETGLDTNARKNRGGHVMEHRIGELFDKYGIKYRSEVSSNEWKEVAEVLGTDKKRFDFVVKSGNKIFLTEVNFYSSGGSKLNEVARSYSEIASRINSLEDFEFVWITDGIGWKSAKNKLQEAYNSIPRVYNLSTVEKFMKDLQEQSND